MNIDDLIRESGGTVVGAAKPQAAQTSQPSEIERLIAEAGGTVSAPVQAEQTPSLASRVGEGVRGVGAGMIGLAGLAGDTAQNIENLARAGVGTVAGMAGRPDLMPDLVSGRPLTSAFLRDMASRVGVNVAPQNPKDPLSQMLYTGGQVVGASAVPGANLRQAVASGVGAAVGEQVAGDTGKMLGAMAPGVAGAAYKQMSDPRKPTEIEKARYNAVEAGYKIPAGMSKDHAFRKLVEGLSGKHRIEQNSILKNQDVTDGLVRRSLGLADDAPLTTQTLEKLRADHGQAYEAVKSQRMTIRPDRQFQQGIRNLGGSYNAAARDFGDLAKNEGVVALRDGIAQNRMTPAGIVEMAKKLRQDASDIFGSNNPGAAQLNMARANRQAADELEALLERSFKARGKGDLVNEFRDSREMIARSWDVQSALNSSGGHVDATKLGRLLQKGRPLGGGLEKVAATAQAFPKAMRTPESVGGIYAASPLDLGMGGVTGLMAGMSTGQVAPGVMAAIAPMLIRNAGRMAAMSGPFQRGTAALPGSFAAGLEGVMPGLLRGAVVGQEQP